MNKYDLTVEGYNHNTEYGKRIGRQLLKLKDAVMFILTLFFVVFGGGVLLLISLLIAAAGMLARIVGRVKP